MQVWSAGAAEKNTNAKETNEAIQLFPIPAIDFNLKVKPDAGITNKNLSLTLQIILLLTILSLAPSIVKYSVSLK